MTLKKKHLIKQVKNFTLNFGPQHPAAHLRHFWLINEKLIISNWFNTTRITNFKTLR